MEEAIMNTVKILLVDDEKPFVETMMKRLKKRKLTLFQPMTVLKH
jgi:ActR/RegA family two-component response regulator